MNKKEQAHNVLALFVDISSTDNTHLLSPERPLPLRQRF